MRIAFTLSLDIERNKDTEPEKEGSESVTERMDQPRMVGFVREDEIWPDDRGRP